MGIDWGTEYVTSLRRFGGAAATTGLTAAFSRMGDRTTMTGEWLAYCSACPAD